MKKRMSRSPAVASYTEGKMGGSADSISKRRFHPELPPAFNQPHVLFIAPAP